jgi:cyclase
MHKRSFISLAATVLGVAGLCVAQQQPSGPFQVHQLTPSVYWVQGGGGNSGIIVGDKGVIVIDAKFTADNGKELLDDVAKITPKPVTTVILTHRDLDHIGGLAAFAKGIQIIAHQVDAGFEAPIPPNMKPPVIIPPTRIITTNKENLTIDGINLQLLHWAPAHTSGDTVVYLPAQKIVFTGDILDVDFPTGHIHASQHGSATGWMETVKGMLALDADRYVPGHGEVQSKQAFGSHLKQAESETATIKQMIGQGKTLAEIQTAVGDPGPNGPRFEPFSAIVYNELTNKQ